MYGLTFDPIVPIQIILLLNFNGPTRGIFTSNKILCANISLVKSEGMKAEMEDAEEEELGNIYGFRDNDILKLDNQRCCSDLPLLLA